MGKTSDSQAIEHLDAYTSDVKLFERQGILESIDKLKMILAHPCPQNRSNGNPAAFWHGFLKGVNPRTEEERKALENGIYRGLVYCKTAENEIFKEQEGIFGLTIINDNTTLVTKEAVVKYIKQQLKERIEYHIQISIKNTELKKESHQ